MTSTPSATAWSIAATRSEVNPLAVAPSCVDQSALYIATRARGAMPEIVPNTAAGPVATTPPLPPAVDEVCVPWPL
jgi:hypothetical protein